MYLHVHRNFFFIPDIFTIRLFNTQFQREKAIFMLVWFSKKDCRSLKKYL